MATAPFMPLAGSVRTSSAPKARSSTRRSRDIDAGIVSTSLYPFAAAMNARPMPVFPDVGSTSVVLPGAMSPLALGVLDHAAADPVLDRRARLHDLELGRDAAREAVGDAVEVDHGRVADQVGHGLGDALGQGARREVGVGVEEKRRRRRRERATTATATTTTTTAAEWCQPKSGLSLNGTTPCFTGAP